MNNEQLTSFGLLNEGLLCLFGIYFILYSENQCISKLDKICIFIDMKFH